MSEIIISNGAEGESKVSAQINKKELTIFDSAVATISFILLQSTLSMVLSWLPLSFTSVFIISFMLSLLVEAIFGFAAIFTCKIQNLNTIKTTKLDKKPGVYAVLIAIALSFICLIFFSGLTNVFVAALEKLGYHQVISNIEIPNFLTYMVYTILIAVSPAFFEEFLFRGVILNGFKKFGKHGAVILSAIIFVFMHGGPDQTIHQFVLGMILGYAYVYSGSLWVPIIIHFVNNFSAVTSLYLSSLFAEEGAISTAAVSYSWLEIAISLTQALMMAVVGAGLVLLCIKGLNKVCKKNTKEQEPVKMIINGQEIQVDESENKIPEKKSRNVWTIILFVVAGLYFAYEWISTLLVGLGVITL